MSYNDLTISQKISIKEIIVSKRRREQLGIYRHEYFNGLYSLAIIDQNFIGAINMFLSA